MDFLHASRRKLKKGGATRESRYMGREGYEGKRRPSDLVWKGDINMPDGASSESFWPSIDKGTRKNGVAAHRYHVALPRQFTAEQNVALLIDIGRAVAGLKPTKLALHCPAAALEGGDQPHGHLLIYPGVPDNVPRPLQQIPKRYNAKDPGQGGWRKPDLRKGSARQELVHERSVIADTVNAHLERNGFSQRVDHRRNTARGLPQSTGRHLGPAGVRKLLKKEELSAGAS